MLLSYSSILHGSLLLGLRGLLSGELLQQAHRSTWLLLHLSETRLQVILESMGIVLLQCGCRCSRVSLDELGPIASDYFEVTVGDLD